MIPDGSEPDGHPGPGRRPARLDPGERRGLPRAAHARCWSKMQDRRGNSPGGAVLGAVGGKVTGVELGMLLSFLASRVLGQYETFAPAGPRPARRAADGGGRLLLVAPNIVHVERELEVDPHDFRLWVCLHEETHRTQFTAVPWLRDHIEGEIQSFLGETDVDPLTVLERLREAAQSLAGGRPEGEDGRGRRPQPRRARADARPARDPRPAHRRDVPARRARRLRDGRRRPRGRAVRRRDPGEVPAAPGAAAPRRLDQALRKLLGPRRQAAAVPGRRAVRTGGGRRGRHGRLQPGLDLARTPSPPRRRSPNRRTGSRGCTARRSRDRGAADERTTAEYAPGNHPSEGPWAHG